MRSDLFCRMHMLGSCLARCDERGEHEMKRFVSKRIVVVDVETSGMSVQRGGRVIEVGALALERGVIVAELDTLIDTGAAISYGAYRVHGISEDMLAGKPLPKEVW